MEELYKDYCSGKSSPLFELYFMLQIPQSYGPRLEKFFIRNNNLTKVPASLDRGDFKNNNEKYYEHKFSFMKDEKFNFVQIRPWQAIEGYALEVLREGKFTQFYISKEDMNTLLEKYGGMAHGTKTSSEVNINKEYALRGKYSSELWMELQKLNRGKSLISC
jgi:hypothetical protein